MVWASLRDHDSVQGAREVLVRWFRVLQLAPEHTWREFVRTFAPEAWEKVEAILATGDALPRHARITLASVALATGGGEASRATPALVDEAWGLLASAQGTNNDELTDEPLAWLPEAVRPLVIRALRRTPRDGVREPRGRARSSEPGAADSSSRAEGDRDTQATRERRSTTAEAPSASQRVLDDDADARQAHTGAGGAATIASPPIVGPRAERPGVTSLDAEVATTTSTPRAERSVRGALGEPCASAGLVLVHPYLARFFRNVGVRREASGALAQRSLSRAAALLHLLATGEDEALEFELPVVKLLLGLTPRDPLVFASGLVTDADREEAEGLLRAVIEHWSALKKTSPRGLRATFLQRRGLLRERDEGWLLQLAPSGVDVLLAQLPWAVSVVRLPWMPRPLFVEWPTP